MQAPATIWLLFAFPAVTAVAQDLRSEMERAERFGREAGSLLEHNEVWPYWADHATRLVYRVNSGRHERQFFQVDLQTGAKAPAFDHAALAKALATAAAREVKAGNLPLEDLQPTPEPGNVRFRAFGKGWRYDAAKLQVIPDDVPLQPADLLTPDEAARAAGGRNSGPTMLTIENGTGGEIEMFWVAGPGGPRQSYGKVAAGASNTLNTYAGHVWVMAEAAPV
jgi:hypothetical protein